jgi:hypothetical protein
MALFANDTAAQRALRRRWLGEEIAADDDEIDKDARLGPHDVGRLVLSAVAVAAAMMTVLASSSTTPWQSVGALRQHDAGITRPGGSQSACGQRAAQGLMSSARLAAPPPSRVLTDRGASSPIPSQVESWGRAYQPAPSS